MSAAQADFVKEGKEELKQSSSYSVYAPKPLTMYGRELKYINEVTYLNIEIEKKSILDCTNYAQNHCLHLLNI